MPEAPTQSDDIDNNTAPFRDQVQELSTDTMSISKSSPALITYTTK